MDFIKSPKAIEDKSMDLINPFIMDIDLGSGNWWVTFFTAILGAVILLWIVGLVTRRR